MNNLRITIEITTSKKLSIGGLRSNIISDIEFTKIDEKPFIPATTLKGILRSCMTRIYGLLLNGEVNYSVYPKSKYETTDIISEMLGKPHNNTSSKVKVSNATAEDYVNIILHHIAIDEKSRIVKENALFSREYVTKGSRFKFTIEAKDLSINEYRLLFLALVEFRYHRIGKSGLVDINIIKNESCIPEEVSKDSVVNSILEVLLK